MPKGVVWPFLFKLRCKRWLFAIFISAVFSVLPYNFASADIIVHEINSTAGSVDLADNILESLGFMAEETIAKDQGGANNGNHNAPTPFRVTES